MSNSRKIRRRRDVLLERMRYAEVGRGGRKDGPKQDRKTDRETATSAKSDTGAARSAHRRIEQDDLQMGKRSFPNKRILRNNLCLPACRILMYKRMALEI